MTSREISDDEWRVIHEAPTYVINIDGVVRNETNGLVIKQTVGKDGKARVMLHLGGRRAGLRRVDQLVWYAFYGPSE